MEKKKLLKIAKNRSAHFDLLFFVACFDDCDIASNIPQDNVEPLAEQRGHFYPLLNHQSKRLLVGLLDSTKLFQIKLALKKEKNRKNITITHL